jgi:membrane-bound acyltransferase YfiQ involved in biofilm formation
MENRTESIPSRKYFIDNIRSTAVLIVIIYHVIYLFNSAGVPKTIEETGIQDFDVFLYFVSPWIMNIMFLLAGISARYSLQKRNGKQFFNERVQKLLLTFVGGMFLLAWINGWVANQYFNYFGENDLPAFIKYIVYCFHIGPLWFNLQLFIVSIVLLLILKIDRRDCLWTLAGKANIFAVITLVLPFWGSSFLLNVPVLTMFRNGIYIFVFLAGYYLFSQDKILEIITKFRLLLILLGLALAVINVYYFFGQNYTEDNCLQHPSTNIYAWIMMLGILGIFHKHFNKTNKILEYLKSRSFFWYLTHMPIMTFIAYLISTKFTLPMIFNYILILIITLVLTVIFCEIVRLIPILRYLLFGIKKEKKDI